MLNVPCALVVHQALLSLVQDLEQKSWYVWLVPEFLDWCEKCLEIEDYGT